MARGIHRHSQPSRQQLAFSHPVAKTLAATRLRQHLKTVQIGTYQLTEGEDATHHLAHCCWIVGLGCETAANVAGLDDRTFRFLHATLRGLQQMCLQGYTWRASMAPQLDAALTMANEQILAHAGMAYQVMPGADQLRKDVLAHQVQANTVSGAEIYQQERAAA